MLILKTLTYPYYVFGNEEFASRTSYYFVLYGAFIDQENLSPLWHIKWLVFAFDPVTNEAEHSGV